MGRNAMLRQGSPVDDLMMFVIKENERAADERLLKELEEAEQKASAALGRYKFQMFGYWAAIWVHINRIGNFKRPNPWKRLVKEARR